MLLAGETKSSFAKGFQHLNNKNDACKQISSLFLQHGVTTLVIPPKSNTFFDWRRTRHVPWVKTHQLPARTKLTNSPGKQH